MNLFKFEKIYINEGYKEIVGIDEAGRGPLAGPVVAVALNWGNNPLIEGINDSKKISEKKRAILFKKIIDKAKDIGIGIVEDKEIDKINILQATYLAMKKAIGNLKIKPDLLLVDGNKADIKHIKQINIIKGDSLSYSIAAASIIAKVTRDKIMFQYDTIFPEYGFAKHKGYGTKFHLNSIYEFYSTPIHRKSFKPVKYYLPNIKFYRDKNLLELLGKQLVAVNLIKNSLRILLFNQKYDIIYIDDKIMIMNEIDTIYHNQIINSISKLNKANFRIDYKNILIDYKLEHITKIRTDKVSINLDKNMNIFIERGDIFEI